MFKYKRRLQGGDLLLTRTLGGTEIVASEGRGLNVRVQEVSFIERNIIFNHPDLEAARNS